MGFAKRGNYYRAIIMRRLTNGRESGRVGGTRTKAFILSDNMDQDQDKDDRLERSAITYRIIYDKCCQIYREIWESMALQMVNTLSMCVCV